MLMLWGSCGGRHPGEGEYRSGGVSEGRRKRREREGAQRCKETQRGKGERRKGSLPEREEAGEDRQEQAWEPSASACMSAVRAAQGSGAGSWAPLQPSPPLPFLTDSRLGPHTLTSSTQSSQSAQWYSWGQPFLSTLQTDSLLIIHYNLMGPLSNMLPIGDQNIVRWHVTVFRFVC